MANTVQTLHISAKVDDRVNVELTRDDGHEIQILEDGYIPIDVKLGRYGSINLAIDFETGLIQDWDDIRQSIEQWVEDQRSEEEE